MRQNLCQVEHRQLEVGRDGLERSFLAIFPQANIKANKLECQLWFSIILATRKARSNSLIPIWVEELDLVLDPIYGDLVVVVGDGDVPTAMAETEVLPEWDQVAHP